MKILITGANGMVAKATVKYCQSIGDETIAVTRQQLDIADHTAVLEIFKREKFDAVINCAAFTDVDGAETNKQACAEANINGVENLALAAREIDCAFVTISTVRSGWIYGHGGTNFLSVMDKLLAGGKSIKAIFDSYGTPTFANDLAKRLRELAELDLPCIFHVTNSGEGTSYAGFAEKICELKGFDKNLLELASADSLKRPAPRPKSSKLACLFSEKFGLKPLPHWEDALAEFLM